MSFENLVVLTLLHYSHTSLHLTLNWEEGRLNVSVFFLTFLIGSSFYKGVLMNDKLHEY